jgi:uncharacterized membrane protein YdjX (TVP38/TMEM64 family)
MSEYDALHVMKRCSQLFWLVILGLTITGFVISDDLQRLVTESQQTAKESPGVVIPLMMAVWVLVAVGAPPGNTFLCIMSGLLYGWWGLFICLGWGAVCASSIGFLVCRMFGLSHIERMVERRPWMQALKRAIDENGAFVTVVARVSPILPFGPSTVVLSVSAIEVSYPAPSLLVCRCLLIMCLRAGLDQLDEYAGTGSPNAYVNSCESLLWRH